MKKKFITPRIEVSSFESQNILTASGPGETAMGDVKKTVTGTHTATISLSDLQDIVGFDMGK